MKVFVVVFALAMLSVASARRGKPEFYWRDFNGTVPRDAFQVAQNGSDEPVYIGQGYFDKVGLLPGMLKSGNKKMSAVADGRVLKIDRNIKIMCTKSRYPETDFQWIKTSYDHLVNIKSLAFLNVPKGGFETESVLYIGRHSEPNYTNIGKIYTLAPYQGLTIPNAKGKPTIYKNFELLALLNFDCDEQDGENTSEESNENSHEMSSPTRHSPRFFWNTSRF